LTEIRYYLDENVDPTVAEQLVRGGIDTLTVRELGIWGESDINHLHKATEMGRVLCTHDTDFLSLASQGYNHAGIVFAEHYGSTIGGWVKALRGLCATTSAEEMIGQVKYVSTK
jgi:hypothetical protein